MLGVIHFPLFVLSCLVLSATPGPAMLYLLGRTISQGRTAGVLSVLGVSTGTLVHTALTAGGLSVLLTASTVAFTVVKVAGAGYLVYLGIKAIMAKANPPEAAEPEPKDVKGAYRQGLVTQVLNPKLGAFMISFLPQFVDPHAKGPVAFLVLGSVLVVVDTICYLGLVVVAAKAAAAIGRNRKAMDAFRRGAGVVYIALGLNLLRAQRAN